MPRPKNEVQLQATVELDVAENGESASVTVARAQNGESWSANRIVELLRSREITEILPRDEIERRLKPLAAGKERTTTFDAAKAESPMPPKPERPVWTSYEIPEKVRAVAEQLLASAPVPTVTREVVTRVKKKKQVTTKPAFPFLPPRQKTVEVVERESRQERVYVDPTVEGSGWVEAGRKLAFIEAADPGVSGKDIYGRPVFTAALPDTRFYAGMNVNRKRDELFAEASGFLRYGSNWAEIIPFAFHGWRVHLTKDQATCLLDLTPGSPAAPIPPAEEIIAATKEHSYPPEALLTASEIAQLVANAIAEGKPVTQLVISRPQDSLVQVAVSPDRLRAVINLRKGRGNAGTLSLKEVGAAITAAGLKSIDKKRIQTEITEFYRSRRIELKDYVLAEGKAAQKGADSVTELSVRFHSGQQTREQIEKLSNRAACAESAASLADGFPADLIEQTGPVKSDQRVMSFSEPSVGESGVDVYGQTIPGVPGTRPSFRLFEHLEQKQNVIIATADGVLDVGKDADGTVLLRVRIDTDAKVEISVSADRMSAELDVSRRIGCGKLADESSIRGAVAAAGVTAGIDDAAIRHAVALAARGERVESVIVARGEPPVRPGQRQLKYLVPLASNRGVILRRDGTADYRNQDRMNTVRSGTVIAEIIRPTAEARDGYDITGKTILSDAGNAAAEIQAGTNVAQTARVDGVTILVAQASGELIVENNTLSIRAAHAVKGDVGLQTGNIRFNGPVYVSGSVRAGFFVVAQGEIRVGEGVESSLISAEEDILVNHGVRGAGKAVLRTKKNLRIGFAEQATLLAVGDILVGSACMHARVKCNGRLAMPGERGNLIGGAIQCRYGVDAANIGSERGVKTHISFGQNYLISDQIDVEVKEIEKLKANIVRVEGLIRKTEDHPGASARPKSPRSTPELTALYHEKSKLLRIMEKRNVRLFTMRERFEEHFESEVRVRGTIYPGTTLESHGRMVEILTPKKQVSYVFNTTAGRIEERPIKDS